jgi:hypothetical protein
VCVHVCVCACVCGAHAHACMLPPAASASNGCVRFSLADPAAMVELGLCDAVDAVADCILGEHGDAVDRPALGPVLTAAGVSVSDALRVCVHLARATVPTGAFGGAWPLRGWECMHAVRAIAFAVQSAVTPPRPSASACRWRASCGGARSRVRWKCDVWCDVPPPPLITPNPTHAALAITDALAAVAVDPAVADAVAVTLFARPVVAEGDLFSLLRGAKVPAVTALGVRKLLAAAPPGAPAAPAPSAGPVPVLPVGGKAAAPSAASAPPAPLAAPAPAPAATRAKPRGGGSGTPGSGPVDGAASPAYAASPALAPASGAGNVRSTGGAGAGAGTVVEAAPPKLHPSIVALPTGRLLWQVRGAVLEPLLRCFGVCGTAGRVSVLREMSFLYSPCCMRAGHWRQGWLGHHGGPAVRRADRHREVRAHDVCDGDVCVCLPGTRVFQQPLWWVRSWVVVAHSLCGQLGVREGSAVGKL